MHSSKNLAEDRGDLQKPPMYDRFLNHVAQTSSEPMGLEVKRADGCWIEDLEGRRYLDLISGISVANLGHGRAEIVAAVREQAGLFMHTMVYGEHVQTPQVRLAERLVDALGDGFETVYFVNSGSEAIEAALKTAKRCTGRYEIASFVKSYHGSTHAALSAMHEPYFCDAFAPLVPGFKALSFNRFEDLESIDERCAAVLVEPIQAEAGCVEATEGFLAALRKRCDQVGALLIFDEIQTGFGRSGSLFAFQREGVIPDLIVLAKALGAGMPLGAVSGKAELFASLRDRPVLGHITTFGGHPVCCAAALAGLDLLLRNAWISEADAKGRRFKSRLLSDPNVREISGRGLMLAVHLKKEGSAPEVARKARALGLITDWFLHTTGALRIAPPLAITKEEIDFACSVLSKALSETTGEA